MLITPRLLAICKMIKDEESVADIGTDHGYVPIYLKKDTNNSIKKLYASDISEGPLNAARINVNAFGFEKEIQLILGNGIKWINDYKVKINTCIIAGLGSNTILNILEDDSDNIDCYVISCNTSVTPIRKWAKSKRYRIEEETLVDDNDIIYEIIKINKNGGVKIKNKSDIIFGPILRKKKPTKIYFEKWLLEEQRQNDLLVKIPKKEKKHKQILKYRNILKREVNKVIFNEFKDNR
ncbi:class I SAM-dependent methyltransferase [Spiroplasma endosymbiont of Othius punctulatus]|uniref:tRNA (adenine(22)-N(1))-methyltransferase n=1 Tax=Spiroplasma endosymbiont of Othius punctulatus TaxID=3066289 RepID=UPI0030CDC3E5